MSEEVHSSVSVVQTWWNLLSWLSTFDIAFSCRGSFEPESSVGTVGSQDTFGDLQSLLCEQEVTMSQMKWQQIDLWEAEAPRPEDANS